MRHDIQLSNPTSIPCRKPLDVDPIIMLASLNKVQISFDEFSMLNRAATTACISGLDKVSGFLLLRRINIDNRFRQAGEDCDMKVWFRRRRKGEIPI